MVQPVPKKMRLEMLVEMQIEILDGQSSGLFLNEPFEKRPVMAFEDFILHSDNHVESHLLGNGLYTLLQRVWRDHSSCACMCWKVFFAE